MNKDCVNRTSITSSPLTFMVSEVSLMQDAAGVQVHFQSAGVGANPVAPETSRRGMAFALETSRKESR